LGCRVGINGLKGLGDAHGENTPLVQHLPYCGIVDAEVARYGVDGQAGPPGASCSVYNPNTPHL
jgi:hypothetical protein